MTALRCRHGWLCVGCLGAVCAICANSCVPSRRQNVHIQVFTRIASPALIIRGDTVLHPSHLMTRTAHAPTVSSTTCPRWHRRTFSGCPRSPTRRAPTASQAPACKPSTPCSASQSTPRCLGESVWRPSLISCAVCHAFSHLVVQLAGRKACTFCSRSRERASNVRTNGVNGHVAPS